MEVAPQYWQSPETLNRPVDQHRRRHGERHAGDQRRGRYRDLDQDRRAAPRRPRWPPIPRINQATNALANTGRGTVSTGSADSTAAEPMVPLASISGHAPGSTPLAVNHQGTFVATTISFNLAPNASLSHATEAIRQAAAQIGMPADIHGSFAGTAATYQSLLEQRADPDPRSARGRLHRARRAVRELHPPDHDPLDAALGRHRGGAGAAALSARSSASSR